MVKREIESTDRAIDRLVYELYGLTEDEVKIVEASQYHVILRERALGGRRISTPVVETLRFAQSDIPQDDTMQRTP